ncbi:hypothetical protein BG74_05960 [Sodalis-like endosymbiont of Proechinophthirus fluctus]|nr:hypothetical protein BG74_05960 [Sodalis-like endosymbiont of Proechinophthirus fluctus]
MNRAQAEADATLSNPWGTGVLNKIAPETQHYLEVTSALRLWCLVSVLKSASLKIVCCAPHF